MFKWDVDVTERYCIGQCVPLFFVSSCSLLLFQLSEGIFVCGDHRATPTLDGAMRSGVLAAEAVVRSLLTGSACNPTSRQRAPRRRAEV